MEKDKELRESPTGNSFLTQFTECPKRWAFKYLFHWIPDKDKGSKDYLVFGQAFHLFKEFFYLNPGKIAEYFERKKAGSELPLPGLDIGEQYIDSFSEAFMEAEGQLLKKRLELAISIWLETYGEQEHQRYEVIGAEMESVLELPNNFKISVRYDAVLKDRETGYVYIFDTKTTRRSINEPIEKYRFSPQPLIYCASVMQSDFPWKADFRGWITDAIFQRYYVRDGWRTEVKRSESVFYTQAEIEEFLKSLVLLTDEMLFCTERFLNDNVSLGESFRMDRNACRNAYGKVCPYYYDCMREWKKEDISADPPEGFTKTEWSGHDIINYQLSGIFKNETKNFKRLG